MKNHEDIINLVKEFSGILDEKLESGELTQYEYDEIKTLDMEYDKLCDPITHFKELYGNRKPIKCSELLLDIYEKHQSSFRKAILLSECFSDPLGYRYTQEIHNFNITIIERAFQLACARGYPDEIKQELRQIYLAYEFFNHNNIRNTEKLDACEFMKFSLSEQIRMIFLFMQDQNRLNEMLRYQSAGSNDFFTGMEDSVSNRETYTNPNVVVSYADSFEGLLDAFDILIRYLYYSKKEDYQYKIVSDHGDITHIGIPSLELITHLAAQRSLLTEMWGKFKYSEWHLDLKENDDQYYYLFSPKFTNEYRQHIIAGNRRKYSFLLNFSGNNINSDLNVYDEVCCKLDKDKIETLFSLDEESYLRLALIYQHVINASKANMHSYYLKLIVNGLHVTDILKTIEVLYVLSDYYQNLVYRDFVESEPAYYKYLCPIIPIEYLVDALIRYQKFSVEYATALINCFIFNPKIKGESDIFASPLVSINATNIIFCPVLIRQLNVARVIEILISHYKVNIARIGTDFENNIRTVFSFINKIEVNTNKINFMASDGKDVEFDFIGVFDDHLLLWEFKAMTTPYDVIKHLECKRTLMEGVAQIERRSQLVKSDWEQIRQLANIELPEKPFNDDKIIKIVGTNIFDFTSLNYGNNIKIVDESTLLKFFISPEIKVKTMGNKETIVSKKLWKNAVPTVAEFKQYLENPITISPYNRCIKSYIRPFDIFEGDYAYAIVDQVLTEDPYAHEIKNTLQINKKSPSKKRARAKKKRKKR